MNTIEFDEHTVGKNQDIKVLLLNGSVDAYNSQMLADKLNDIIQEGFYKIIMDCSRLRFISSSGMGVFLAMEDDLRRHNGGLKFVVVSDIILNVFKKVGLADIFKIYYQESLAIEEFNREI